MIGIGFWEMVLIGVAQLIVVGIPLLVVTVMLVANAGKRDDRLH